MNEQERLITAQEVDELWSHGGVTLNFRKNTHFVPTYIEFDRTIVPIHIECDRKMVSTYIGFDRKIVPTHKGFDRNIVPTQRI